MKLALFITDDGFEIRTASFDSVIGPRIAKGQPLPDWPTKGPNLAEIEEHFRLWDTWINEQENRLKVSRTKRK